ncbi:MAG: hypothetical protein V4723_01960 [Pseudomonadota bacterium]
MDDDNASSTGAHAKVVGVKSWLAYLGNLLLALILFGAVLPLTFTFAGEIPAAVVLVISAVIVLYQFLVIRSVQLYYDDVGVWVVSGVLPWNKGITGVKWRDMDEATFVQGFWSWITRSYDIRIGHRFTKGSEIVLTNIAGGKTAIATLNSHHQNLIRDRVIE